MKAFITTLSILLTLAAAGCGGSSAGIAITGPAIAFLFIVGQGSNNITGFKQVSDGELTQLSVSVASNPIPVAMALHPSKNFVYVPNSTSNTVSGYMLDHTSGVLAPVGTAIPPSSICPPLPAACSTSTPVSAGIDSAGHFLFVLNQGSVAPPVGPSLSVFSIDTNRGLLTLLPGSPFVLPSLSAGTSQLMVVSPSAGFLYVANGTAGTIAQISFNSNGQPADMGTVSGGTGATVAGMTIDPKGQVLYATDSANNKILSFTIPSSGVLAPIAAFSLSQTTAETTPVAVAVDSTGTLLYSANQGSGNVSAFKTSGGNLTEVSGSPYGSAGAGVVTAPQPASLTVDVTNGFLYVANEGSHSVMAFSIKATDGTLTAVTNAPFAQTVGPTGLLSTK
jgi:6-phosphogluconolactonase (cycloisomerase 2 family)